MVTTKRLPDVIVNTPTEQFTIIPNELIRNPDLSWKAKGVLSFLLSGKDGEWYSYTETIIKHSTDGRKAVKAAIKELKEAGYLIKLQCRDKKSKLTGGVTWICSGFPLDFGDIISLSEKLDKYGLEPHSKEIRAIIKDILNGGKSTGHENGRAVKVQLRILNSKNTKVNTFGINCALSDESTQVKKKRTRNRKPSDLSKSSIKEKRKQKASEKKKTKKESKPQYYSKINTQLLEYWNKQDNLRKHKNPDSKVYKDSLKKIDAIRKGKLEKMIDIDSVKNGFPIEYYGKKWSRQQIAKAIRTLNAWCKEGNYPANKTWIKKLSLADAIFNSRNGSPLFQAFYKGIVPLQVMNNQKKLTSEHEKLAYSNFANFFMKNKGTDKLPVQYQNEIIDLVKDLSGLREKYKYKWIREIPEKYRPPKDTLPVCATVQGLAYVYVAFLNRIDEFSDSDFVPQSKLTPKKLKQGDFIWDKFSTEFERKMNRDVVTGDWTN